MKIVIAPQGFKGSLKAQDAAAAMAVGVKSALPDAEVIEMPIADGGEGTVRAMVKATGGRLETVEVFGPLGDPVKAIWGTLSDGKTAVIEMAAASGLNLVPEDRRNPLRASTYGIGELIRAALESGCDKFIIGLGDSATVDGGAGMAEALGVRLLDADGRPIPRGGIGLLSLVRIDISGRHEAVLKTEIIGACDVTNPLYGPEGAAYIYGPQKGATPDMIKRLDAGLRNLAAVIARDLGIKVDDLSGGGAAGGLGAGLVAFLNAKLQPGIDLVLDGIGFEKHLEKAALVLTGEGRIDHQTPRGKTIAGIAHRARKAGLPVIAFAGELGEGYRDIYRLGVEKAVGIVPEGFTKAEAMNRAAELLSAAVERTLRNTDLTGGGT